MKSATAAISDQTPVTILETASLSGTLTPTFGTFYPMDTAPKSQDFHAKSILAVVPQFRWLGDGERIAVHPEDQLKIIWWEPKLHGGCWVDENEHICFPVEWTPLPPFTPRT